MEDTKYMSKQHKQFTTTMNELETMRKVRENCLDKTEWDKYRNTFKKTNECDLGNVLPYPIMLQFELNGTCNYRCESCSYRVDKRIKREEISLEQFENIIKDGVKRGLRTIRLNHHNEPLLKKDLGEYIKIAKEAGILDVYLSTNGSLLDEDRSNMLIKSGLDRLQVSIDAFTEKTYNHLRPGGNFKNVVDNVRNFINMRNAQGKSLPTVRVNFVKQKENEEELENFIEYWNKVGVDSIGVQDYSDWEHEKPDELYEDVKFHCSFPFNNMVIRYNGDVQACCMFFSEELVIGNINENSISELWQCDTMKKLRCLAAEDDGWRKHPVCKKCVKSVIEV